MILNLEKIVSLKKTIKESCPKTGDQKKDSIYFDFDKNKAFFHNERFNGEVDFSFEVDSMDEEIVNFYVNTFKFFFIINDFDPTAVQLSFEHKDGSFIPVFHKDKDIYKISYIISEDDLSMDIDEKEYQSINLLKDDIKMIEEAALFIDYNDEYSFNSVAISSDSKVFGTTPTRFFEGKLEETIKDSFFIHRDVVKALVTLDSCNVLYTEGRFIIKNKDYRLVYNTGASHTVIPSEEDKGNVVSKEHCIILDKNELKENLKFFEPFYTTDSKPIRLTIEDNETMKISTVSSYDIVEKSISAKSENLVGFTAKYNATIIKNILNIFEEKELMVYVDSDKIGALFTDSTNKKEAVVIQYAESD